MERATIWEMGPFRIQLDLHHPSCKPWEKLSCLLPVGCAAYCSHHLGCPAWCPNLTHKSLALLPPPSRHETSVNVNESGSFCKVSGADSLWGRVSWHFIESCSKCKQLYIEWRISSMVPWTECPKLIYGIVKTAISFFHFFLRKAFLSVIWLEHAV